MFGRLLALATVLLCLSSVSNAQFQHGIPVQYGAFIPTNQTNIGYNPKPQAYNQPSTGPAYYGWNPSAFNNTATLNNHDLVIGARAHGDTLLLKTLVTKPVGWLRSSAEKTILFPPLESKQRINRITSIVVTDNSKKGTGGHTQIIAGGAGKSFAEMRFKSNNGKKIDLSVNIYGFE